MERSPYAPVVPSYEASNPLRPYYRPQSISERMADYIPNSTSASASKPLHQNLSNLSSSARDILSDLNYSDVLNDAAPSTTESLRGLLDQAVWRYSSVFMAQPFEVAKMVLQCRVADSSKEGGITGRGANLHRPDERKSEEHGRHHARHHDEEDEEDEEEEPSYFTYATPLSSTPASETPFGHTRSRRSKSLPSRAVPTYRLDLRRSHSLLEVIGQLWQREGAWGVWKGTNISFIYGLLLKTTQTWTRSMLSALLNLPDPGSANAVGGSVGGLDILDSPSPLMSLLVVVTSAGLAGLLVAPLDIVKTRIMLTSVSEQPLSIFSSFRRLKTWMCPPSLLAPTIVHSTLPTLISTSTPLLLRNYLNIDPLITPGSYSICTFLSSCFDLFATLPFETVLRRAQVDYAAQAEAKGSPVVRSRSRGRLLDESTEDEALPTVINIGRYNGVMSTVYSIIWEEGETLHTVSGNAKRRGQGVQGLWRGWRVGMWGIVGVWTAAALGQANSKGGEF